MATRDDLCRLVIRNMEIIEEAPKIVEEVEKTLLGRINERIRDVVSSHAYWEGVYELATGKYDETSFFPVTWPKYAGGGYKVWYALWHTREGEKLYWLSNLLGVHGAACCLKFGLERDFLKGNASARRNQLQDFYVATPELREAGFLYDGTSECFYRPFILNVDAVASEFPDVTDALTPLDEALKALFAVHPLLDAFVQREQKNSLGSEASA